MKKYIYPQQYIVELIEEYLISASDGSHWCEQHNRYEYGKGHGQGGGKRNANLEFMETNSIFDNVW